VTLIPPSGDYAATFNATHPRIAIYIDVAWDVHWETGALSGSTWTSMSCARDGRGIWIDDRDEWDEHRVAYGYPLDIVARLEQVATDLEREVTQEAVPFDGPTAAHWLSELDRLAPARR
jgi:protein associated with RNAse G/E